MEKDRQRNAPSTTCSASSNTPRMRKLIVVVLLLAVVGTVIFAWLMLSSRQSAPSPPTVSFTGREPGPAFRAAGFYVTNSGRQAILLFKVQVQVAVKDRWKTVSEKQVEFSPKIEAGVSPSVHFSGILEVGEYRKMIVEWPEEKPWRVCILYFREKKGLDLLTARARLAWRTRSMAQWRGRVYDDSAQIISENVTR
jgi:flagellar basal body-associated protein FliL